MPAMNNVKGIGLCKPLQGSLVCVGLVKFHIQLIYQLHAATHHEMTQQLILGTLNVHFQHTVVVWLDVLQNPGIHVYGGYSDALTRARMILILEQAAGALGVLVAVWIAGLLCLIGVQVEAGCAVLSPSCHLQGNDVLTVPPLAQVCLKQLWVGLKEIVGEYFGSLGKLLSKALVRVATVGTQVNQHSMRLRQVTQPLSHLSQSLRVQPGS